jgi:hypothetical protein
LKPEILVRHLVEILEHEICPSTHTEDTLAYIDAPSGIQTDDPSVGTVENTKTYGSQTERPPSSTAVPFQKQLRDFLPFRQKVELKGYEAAVSVSICSQFNVQPILTKLGINVTAMEAAPKPYF